MKQIELGSEPRSTLPVRCWIREAIDGWVQFWFTPIDPVGLHVLRVLAGLLFLGWLVPFAGTVDGLFGLDGWFDQTAYADLARLSEGLGRPTSWSLLYLCGSSKGLLMAAYAFSLIVLALFTFGIAPRVTAVATWLIVTSFAANPVTEYEGDALLGILAFYLMLGYLLLGGWRPGQSVLGWLLDSRDTWLRAARPEGPRTSSGANLALRLIQVHFAMVLVTSGLHKLQFGDWWAGVALWYPLYPPLQTSLAEARRHAEHGRAYLFILSLLAYLTLAWQLTFPWFAWKQRWRGLLLGGAMLGWLGLACIYGLPWLGPILVVGGLSYVTSEEWRNWQNRCWRLAVGPSPAAGTEQDDVAPMQPLAGTEHFA